jgi:hypothetical protein
VVNRPQIDISIGSSKRAITTPALVDTGASVSAISRDLAIKIFSAEGRPYLLHKVKTSVTSATGHGLHICGLMETKVSCVGVISLYVVRNLSNHQCILGWDMLSKHGFDLNETNLQWGEATFKLGSYRTNQVANIQRESNQLQAVLDKYKRIFGEPNQLKPAKVPAMTIETVGDPIYQRAYRTPLTKREAIDTEIDKMLELGIIRESSSPWGSPVLLVPKKDGELRFCVDYRKVNEITTKNRYPLPFVQDIFDQLGGAKIFSTLDMRSGYFQVPLDPSSVSKTAFVCHRGQYEFLRVPFGLTNAPAHYQAIMNNVLAKHIGKRVMVFLDDVVVYSKDPAQHAADLDMVLADIAAANLTLKESKCHFGGTELDLLGYVISANGIKAQPSKTTAINQLPAPTNINELRRFLGMCSYYRQLVPKFAEIAEPLFSLTRKGVEWGWNEETNNAFQKLKAALCSNQVMAHPDPHKPYILYTDACDYAIGGILCQEDENGTERPIQYISAQLTSTQRRWATVEKECWAVVYCLDKLRCYLLGAEFVVFTDHKPLLCLFTSQMKNTKIQRWGILFEEFGAVIKYRPGANNVRADMLSRISAEELAVIDMSSEWVNLDETRTSEFHCYDNIDKDLLIRDQGVEFSNEIENVDEPDSGYIMHEGILYSRSHTNRYEPKYPRIVLPSSFRRQIMERCHKEAAHAGALKTMLVVQEGYVWQGMRAEIESFVKKCPLCQVHVNRPEKPPMGDMPIAQSPAQVVGLDLIGPLMTSTQGNSYIMVVIDHFSGWIEAYPLPNKSNEAVWERMRNDYFPRHGACRVLITDQGAEFKGKDWDEWLRGNRVEHRRTTPYHPQSNGKCERANRTIKEMIRKLINGQRSNWEDKLGTALWAIRTNTSMVTGFSPFFLHHARPARAPISDMLSSETDYTFQNRLGLQSEVFRAAAKATEESRKYNQSRLQEKAKAKAISVGDHVLLKANEPLSLTAKWDYGYVVTKVNGLTLDLLHPESGATMRVHREKVVLTDPDVAWEEVSPRPRRKRQQVKQVHVPKRRDRVRRDSESSVATSVATVRSRQSINQRDPKIRGEARNNRDTRTTNEHPALNQANPRDTRTTASRHAPNQMDKFVVPSGLPPFSQKRQREPDDEYIAKRTRSRLQGEKRTAELGDEPDTKRWRAEQISLLDFVSRYFSGLV